MRPIWLAPASVNQRLPSGPVWMRIVNAGPNHERIGTLVRRLRAADAFGRMKESLNVGKILIDRTSAGVR
jgi:hypothetical protein